MQLGSLDQTADGVAVPGTNPTQQEHVFKQRQPAVDGMAGNFQLPGQFLHVNYPAGYSRGQFD